MNSGYVIYAQDRDGACGYVKKETLGNKTDDLITLIGEEMNDSIRIFPTQEAAETRMDTMTDDFVDYIEYTCIMFFDGQMLMPIDSI